MLEFDTPTPVQIRKLITTAFAPMKASRLSWKKVVAAAEGLSQSEIVRATDDAVKTTILDERDRLSEATLISRLNERHSMRLAFLDGKGS